MSLFKNLGILGYHPLVASDERHGGDIAAELANVVGSPLPDEYVTFLEEFPSSGLFDVQGVVFIASSDLLSGKHDGHYAIDMLYAGCSDENYDVVALARQPLCEDSMPRHLLQIGEDSFGNAFCLDLRPEAFGQVYFWDHEHGANETGLHLMAENFVSFVDRLQVDA